MGLKTVTNPGATQNAFHAPDFTATSGFLPKREEPVPDRCRDGAGPQLPDSFLLFWVAGRNKLSLTTLKSDCGRRNGPPKLIVARGNPAFLKTI
jgi:hypothetical protein